MAAADLELFDWCKLFVSDIDKRLCLENKTVPTSYNTTSMQCFIGY